MSERNFSVEDLSRNRTWAALGYLVFLIPLIKCKNSPLGRYCANQGLILWILFFLVGALFGILGGIPLLGWLFHLIGRLACLALVVVGLLCMIQLMTNDRVCKLPLVGFIRLLR